MTDLSAIQIARLAAKVGWPTDQIANITAIALAESSGNPSAASSDSNGGAFGLTQINRQEFAKYGKGNIDDPRANLAAALAYWRVAGYNPWCTATPAMNHGQTGCSGYGSGNAAQYMAQATAAAHEVGGAHRGTGGGTPHRHRSTKGSSGHRSGRKTRVIVSPPEMASLATLIQDSQWRVISVERQARTLLIGLLGDLNGSAGEAGADIQKAVTILDQVTGQVGLPHVQGALYRSEAFVRRVAAQAERADEPSATLTTAQRSLLATLAHNGVNKATLAKDRAEMLAHDRAEKHGTRHHGTGSGTTTVGGTKHPGAGSATTTSVANAWHVLRATGGIPPGLRRYGNGHIPLTSLRQVGPGQYLWKPAATSFLRMQSAARASGVHLTLAASYRPYAKQVALTHSEPGLAATPGTSNHGWSRAIDVDGAGAQRWLDANAQRFGWFHQVPGEPWHFSFGPEHIA